MDQKQLCKLEDIKFDNLVLRALPVEEGPNVPRPVAGACFSRVSPTPLSNPRMVAMSGDALQLLGLDPEDASSRPQEFAEYFSGNRLLPGSQPAAHCYAGHQFGSFAGQLGDGAAVYLGDLAGGPGGGRWELQLKGAGITPYSRAADGRKVLRSSLREFMCSEHMAALGIPTTRAGSLVTSDTLIERDPHYDGNIKMERASVVSRIAPSFLRFGSFEIFKPADPSTGRSGPSVGREGEMMPVMIDYVIRALFHDIWLSHGGPEGLEGGPEITPQQRADMAADWFVEVCRRTARMVALWQCVGFCHGVLNTDNMSILGLTIDYGPFGFMDRFDPHHVCNGSDDTGRYNYQGQPEICRWNCEMLAAAVGGSLLPPAKVRAGLAAYDREFQSVYRSTMRRKLGLMSVDLGEEDDALLTDLMATMEETGADWTRTWRRMATVPMPPPPPSAAQRTDDARMDHQPSGSGQGAAEQGVAGQRAPAGAGEATGVASAAGATPGAPTLQFDDGGFLAAQLGDLAGAEEMARGAGSSIPEENLQMLSYLAQRDPAVLHSLGVSAEFIKLQIARSKEAARWRATTPVAKASRDATAWSAWLSRYGARLQREAAAGAPGAERVRVMNSTNPRVVLRNWVAEEAIRAAESGDYEAVRQLLSVMTQPYKEPHELQQTTAGGTAGAGTWARAGEGEDVAGSSAAVGAPEPAPTGSGGVCPLRIGGKPPSWAGELCVTCSS